ncbi:LOW QUALITY PROTEIN: hypothetical protein NC652_028864 [Populus alba x Populus x berolinensis]|nr:LOW QUALITY PROTEIN: hypothetical protein NC652_028864 [Populus alba x Populus x berolinensis]
MKCFFFFWETHKLLNPSSTQSPVLVNNSNNNLSVHAKGGPISIKFISKLGRIAGSEDLEVKDKPNEDWFSLQTPLILHCLSQLFNKAVARIVLTGDWIEVDIRSGQSNLRINFIDKYNLGKRL